MKRYSFSALTLVFALLAGCKKEFLEIVPRTSESVVNFYKTASDFNVAVMGAYDGLQRTYNIPANGIWVFSDLRSDVAEVQTKFNAEHVEIDEFTLLTPRNSLLRSYWDAHYSGILRANLIIDKINTVAMADNLKAQYRGEALFIRALHYFNLVRVFGDVPLVLKELSITESYTYVREPQDKVYDQIVADLQAAIPGLLVSYPTSQAGRVTNNAAKALLGKVYLTRKNYASASAILAEVISSNRYSLLTNYADVFNLNPAISAPEIVFDVQYAAKTQNEGSRFYQVFVPQNAYGGQGQGIAVPTISFINAFTTGDNRRAVTVANNIPGSSPAGSFGVVKYQDANAAVSDAGSNWIVIRYADVLLMYAEALNEESSTPSAQAIDAVNRVRRRAFGQPINSATPTTADVAPAITKDEFRRLIENERRLELGFEGHRWFDLVRTGRALQVLNVENPLPSGRQVTQRDLLLPIPQSIIDVNPKITQNPGYL